MAEYSAPTVDELIKLVEAGLIGQVEARTVLGHMYTAFADARDNDIDDEVREVAERAAQERRQRWEADVNAEKEMDQNKVNTAYAYPPDPLYEDDDIPF